MAKRNYNKPATLRIEDNSTIVDEVVPGEPVDETVSEVEQSSTMKGVVNECERLNVRRYASIDAPIICSIAASTEVEINRAESTFDFWKVYLVSGIEGFCMKKYIKITQIL